MSTAEVSQFQALAEALPSCKHDRYAVSVQHNQQRQAVVSWVWGTLNVCHAGDLQMKNFQLLHSLRMSVYTRKQ